MNKKLMAVAVAGALAVPGVALAQSSVTISGVFKMSLDHVSIGSFSAARAAGAKASEWRVVDESSRIIFNVTEDLGGGLQAIGQVDWRVTLDVGADAAGGNNWVGLRSKSWGTLTLGRHDLHYGKQPDDVAAKGASLKLAAVSLMDYIQGTPIANATRTTNVIRYDSPNWGGFNLTVAHSQNPSAAEAEIGSAVRRGKAWNINPYYTAANWQLGYTHWNAKSDAALAGEQRSDVLYGYWRTGGFKVGAAWNRSRIHTGGGADTARRTAWTIPLSYTWGKNSILGHYTKARNDTVTAADDSAKMFALAYVYDLSKRTSVAMGYGKITNAVAATYNFFTTGGGLGSASAAVLAGEDPRLLAFTVRHAF